MTIHERFAACSVGALGLFVGGAWSQTVPPSPTTPLPPLPPPAPMAQALPQPAPPPLSLLERLLGSENLFGAVAVAVAALGLFLLWRALISDRSRGRARCPRCWYDLTGAPRTETGGAKCPECGHAAAAARDLLRTRRRWRWALAALAVLLVANTARVAPQIRDHGWRRAVPTTLLAIGAPLEAQAMTDSMRDYFGSWSDGAMGGLYADLLARDKEGRVWPWQRAVWRVLVRAGGRAQGLCGLSAQDRAALDALDTVLAGRAIEHRPLKDAALAIASEAGVELVVDEEGLTQAGEYAMTDLSLELPSMPAGEMLDELARAASRDIFTGIVLRVRDGAAVLEPRSNNSVGDVVAIHDIGSLRAMVAARQKQPLFLPVHIDDAVVSLFQSFITPDEWLSNGGMDGDARLALGGLIVRQHARQQREVERFLDAMRRALREHRKGGAGGMILAEVDSLAGARRLEELLATRRVSRTLTNATLADVVDAARSDCGVGIVMNRAALRLAGADDDRKCAGVTIGLPWNEALDAALASIADSDGPLIGRTVLGDSVLITSAEQARQRTCIAVFAAKPEETWQNMLNTIDPDGWTDNGGETGSYREFGDLRVVRNTARNLLAIERMLTSGSASSAHAGPP